MQNKSVNKIERSNLFSTLFAEAEKRDEYHVAGMKIEIAEQIYRMMDKKHVSQADLARRLGKNRAYISKALKGTTNFTIETLVKIGRQLDAKWEISLIEAQQPENKVFSDGGWNMRSAPLRIHLMEVSKDEYVEPMLANRKG